MKIESRADQLTLGRQGWLAALQAHLARLAQDRIYPLRFALVEVEGTEAQVEISALVHAPGERFGDGLEEIEVLAPRRRRPRAGRFVAVQVVPTGIGCSIGGYAGDAAPASNLLAAATDLLVTHPNAVNASDLNEMAANVLYVEGKLLDDFLLGRLALRPVAANTIGTAVDPAGGQEAEVVVETLNAARASAGIDCASYLRLKGELGVRTVWLPSGAAAGTLDAPEVLLDGVARLVKAGATAVGAVSVIHGVTREDFRRHQEEGRPNPSGGVEAIITHLISKIFCLPSAHAPLPYYQEQRSGCEIDPRAAAELISTPHYFSVLKGLSRAPQPRRLLPEEAPRPDEVHLDDVDAVVLPASALGGVPALAAELSGIPILAVAENETILDVTADKMRLGNVVLLRSYAEAAGTLLALRQGISLESLTRPLGGARELS